MKRLNEKDFIIVSACLLGSKVRYDGKEKKNSKVIELVDYFNIIPICPEVDGGLKIPRDPCEIVSDKVLTKEGKDCTKEYHLGSEKALHLAKYKNIRFAILKEGSPSCGVKKIYDGSFSNRLISGSGITAKAFIDAGIKVYSEDDIDIILKKFRKTKV